MSDKDKDSSAWRIRPSDYLRGRAAEYVVPDRPLSAYIEMDDGCRLAADVYLPQSPHANTKSSQFPTIAVFTPYYRRFAVVDETTATERSPNTWRYRDMFVPRGYALVVVDVRGTGASFGRRDSFRSPRERDDYRSVVDWIVAEDWSNGDVGSTGISYLGAASDFMLSTGHPAIKAVAPLFAVFDTYSENCYPGGLLLLNRIAGEEGQLMNALDRDVREDVRRFSYFRDPNLAGPQPVDADADGSLCRAAIHEHGSNFRMADFITEFRFKDSALPYNPEFTPALMGPYYFAESATPGAAVLCVSGWMDGAGYSNGSISRYLTHAGSRPVHLLLGPWDHGARVNISPWRGAVVPEFPFLGEVLRFFDHYLKKIENSYAEEAPIHYFSMHDEQWRSAKSWPPHAGTRRYGFGSDNRLLEGDEGATGTDAYQVDFMVGTGRQSRYERTAALIDATNCYPDWRERQDAFLNYTSEALDEPLTVTGHIVVSMDLISSEPDASLFVYVTEIEADGAHRYVTEGMLRALHRAHSEPPSTYRCTWPYHSLKRTDARPLQPNVPARIEFALLPTSWTFSAGSRIRISLSGSDAEHYGQVPHGRPPLLTLVRGARSYVDLPIDLSTDLEQKTARR